MGGVTLAGAKGGEDTLNGFLLLAPFLHPINAHSRNHRTDAFLLLPLIVIDQPLPLLLRLSLVSLALCQALTSGLLIQTWAVLTSACHMTDGTYQRHTCRTRRTTPCP